jgi:hypothetical protein
VPKISVATPGRGGEISRHGDRGAERQARRLTCAERHERVSRGVSAPRCVFGHRRGLCEVFECPSADRDAIASQLLRYRDERGDGWADIIDLLTMYPDTRRRVVRVLAEIEARPT